MAESGKSVILLVEAEPLPALARKVTLERHGYAVISANSGNKAVEIAGNTLGIDLIVMAFRLAEQNHTIVGSNALVAAASAQLRLINQRLPWWPGIAECVVETDLSAIAILDRELNFMYVSDRFVDDYCPAESWSESWAIGRHYSEVLPETPPAWRDVHRRALSGEALRSDADCFGRSDGTIDSTRWECHPWYEVGGAVGGIVLYTEMVIERETAALPSMLG